MMQASKGYPLILGEVLCSPILGDKVHRRRHRAQISDFDRFIAPRTIAPFEPR